MSSPQVLSDVGFFGLTHCSADRACVGKNLASMELVMIIGTVMKRYEFVPEVVGESVSTPISAVDHICPI